MLSPYTTSAPDIPEYKSLICGRKNDIITVLDHISRGESIMVFGERGIGKTSFLFVLRDVINGEIDSYRTQLIDKELQKSVNDLKAKVPHFNALFVNLKRMSLSALSAGGTDPMLELMSKSLEESSLIKGKGSLANCSSLPELFDSVEQLLGGDRLVILMDEMNVLDFEKSGQILDNLESIKEACHNRIIFVFSGNEFWYRQSSGTSFSLIYHVNLFFLKIPSHTEIENHLIREILANPLYQEQNLEEVVQAINDWTGGKPHYIQIVCGIFFRYGDYGKLPGSWREKVEGEALEQGNIFLKEFFNKNKVDELSRNILVLLAHKPGLTVGKMARLLHLSKQEITEKLSDLMRLNKVNERGDRYRIVGTLVEIYAKKNEPLPPLSNAWPQYRKLIAAAVFLLLAVAIYFYTNPQTQTLSFMFSQGVVSVQMPASLENDEQGTAVIKVDNTSTTKIDSITIILDSQDIDYSNLNGTNRIQFSSIDKQEVKHMDVAFTSDVSISKQIFSSTIFISKSSSQPVSSYGFDISRRTLPIKKYWQLLSGLFGALTVLLTGQSIWSFLASLFGPDFLKSRFQSQS